MPEHQAAPALAVHVCSRDGAERVGRLLRDLTEVVAGLDVSVTVYDDSTTPAHRGATWRACTEAGLPVRYFGEADRRDLVAGARRRFGPAADVLAASRPLGTGRWDLAGCRFTAMLAGAMHPDPSVLHLFLDDDLRLVDCRYAGRRYTVDTDAVREMLTGTGPAVPPGRLFAAGVGMRGRADISVLEHLDASIAGDGGRLLADGRVPALVTADDAPHPDSPGISGGFLLTNRSSLRAVPLSRSYDEDWIWLRQLAMAGGTIHRCDAGVVHGGSTTAPLSVEILRYQFDGEVLDAAVRLCAAAGMPFEASPEFVVAALDVCTGRLDATRGRAASAGMAAVVGLLRALRSEVATAPPASFADRLARHAERSRRWAPAFDGPLAHPAPASALAR